jgi:hypothetical protein
VPDFLKKFSSVAILGNKVVGVIVDKHLEKFDNVRVVHRDHDVGFLDELLFSFSLKLGFGNYFDSSDHTCDLVEGLVHLAKATLAKEGLDFIEVIDADF